MSPDSSSGTSSAMVLSTTATGTISQTTRGRPSFFTKSCSDAAPVAFSCASAATAFGKASNTTQSWPPLMSRRTMFAPMRPRPIIPSCIASLLVYRLSAAGRCLQPLHGRRDAVAVAEDCRARDEHVGAGPNDERGGVRVDPPVDVQVAARPEPLDQLARASDLRQRRVDEMLVTETRIDGHDQHL